MKEMKQLIDSILPYKQHQVNNNFIFVSSFGKTMKLVNGSFSQFNGFDWYYKGNGNSLIYFKNKNFTLPRYGIYPSVESEIVLIHYINVERKPIYIGYTLGVDYSYAGMRREHEYLKNLSHLSYTKISDKFQESQVIEVGSVETKIMREGKEIHCSIDKIGNSMMWVKSEDLMKYLFRNKHLLVPGTLFFTLTGAVFSTSKLQLKLKVGDSISVNLLKSDLKISVKILEY